MAPRLFIPQKRDAHAHQYSFELLGGIPYTYKTSRQKTFAKRLAVAFGVERSRAWLDEYVRALFTGLARCATDYISRKTLAIL